jgi:hypothetical protein
MSRVATFTLASHPPSAVAIVLEARNKEKQVAKCRYLINQLQSESWGGTYQQSFSSARSQRLRLVTHLMQASLVGARSPAIPVTESFHRRFDAVEVNHQMIAA